MVRCHAFLASLALAAALQAQGTSAVLADGRLVTPLVPQQIFITEGPITGLDPANHAIFAQGLKVTIPATIDGVAVGIGNTNFAGAPITAASMHALLDVNAAPGGRDTDGVLKTGAVRSIFGSSKLQLQAQQDAPASLSMRQQMMSVRSAIAAGHAVPVLPSEGIVALGQADDPLPNAFEYTGATLKSAGQVYVDAQGNQFLIPDGDVVIEMAENLTAGPITSINATGAFPSFVVGEMPVVLNPDPRFPTTVLGLAGVELTPQVFYQALATQGANLGGEGGVVAEGYVVDGVLFATVLETGLTNPAAAPIVTIDRATFDNRANEVRLRGTVDKPAGLRVRIEFLRNTTVAATFVENLVVAAGVPGAEWLYRGRNTIPGGVATITSIRLTLINAANAAVNTRTYLRSEL